MFLKSFLILCLFHNRFFFVPPGWIVPLAVDTCFYFLRLWMKPACGFSGSVASRGLAVVDFLFSHHCFVLLVIQNHGY